MMEFTKTALPSYLIGENNTDALGCEFVFATNSPHYFSQIFKFSSTEEMNEFIDSNDCRERTREMLFYNICCIGLGPRIQSHPTNQFYTPEPVLEAMLHFYYLDRVSNRTDIEVRYRR